MAKKDLLVDGQVGIDMAPGTWFREETREMTIFAEQYDFVVTLLLLSNDVRYGPLEVDTAQDTYDRLVSRA